MSVWASFGSAYNTEIDRGERKRLELAKAFEEFKRNNPYATVADYQGFMDSASGGSNYLRGGMPSRDVLENLAQRNQQALEQKQLMDYTARVKALGEMEGTLASDIDRRVMGVSDGNWDQAFEDFQATLPQGAGSSLLTQRIRGKFTDDHRNRLIQNAIRDNQANAVTYLTNTGGGGDLTDEEFANYFGLPVDVGKQLRTIATEKYGQQQDRILAENRETLIRLAMEGMENNLGAEGVRGILNNWSQGFTNPITIPDEYAKSIEEEAARRRQVTIDDRNRQLLGQAKDASRGVVDSYIANTNNNSLIITGDAETWQQTLLDQIKDRLSDEEFELQYGVTKDAATTSLVAPYYDAQLRALQIQQRTQQTERRENLADQVIQYGTTFDERNSEQAKAYFESLGQGGDSIAALLSRKYEITGTNALLALNIAEAAIADNADMGAAEIVALIEQNPTFQANSRSVFDAKSNYASTMAATKTAFNVETFDSYINNIGEETASTFNTANENLSEIAEMENPEQRIAALNALRTNIGAFVEDTTRRHTVRGNNRDRWVEYGSGGWNNELGQGFEQTLGAGAQQLYGQIDRLIEAANNEMEEAANNNTVTSGTMPDRMRTSLAVMTDPSSASYTPMDTYQDRVDFLDKFARVLSTGNQHPRSRTVNQGREEDHHYAQMLKAFLGDEGGIFSSSSGVREKIASNPELFNQFITNPLQFMVNDTEFLQLNPIYNPSNPENPFGTASR